MSQSSGPYVQKNECCFSYHILGRDARTDASRQKQKPTSSKRLYDNDTARYTPHTIGTETHCHNALNATKLCAVCTTNKTTLKGENKLHNQWRHGGARQNNKINQPNSHVITSSDHQGRPQPPYPLLSSMHTLTSPWYRGRGKRYTGTARSWLGSPQKYIPCYMKHKRLRKVSIFCHSLLRFLFPSSTFASCYSAAQALFYSSLPLSLA